MITRIYLAIIIFSFSLSLGAEPVVSMIAPVAGATISPGDIVTISASLATMDLDYYQIAWSTDNARTWSTAGVTLTDATAPTTSAELGTWVTTGNAWSSWRIRLTVYTTAGERYVAYAAAHIDNSVPAINPVTLKNLTTGNDLWVKNGDQIAVVASLTDDYELVTANITADLSDFGLGRYTAPTAWTASTGGIATWNFTVKLTTGNTKQVTVTVQDFGNNSANNADQIEADIILPQVKAYANGERLFRGDFFEKDVVITANASDNNTVVDFELSFYEDNILLASDRNNSGAMLTLSATDLESHVLRVIAVAQDQAGNITTADISALGALTSPILEGVKCGPNPFNPRQTELHIGYKLSRPDVTKVSVYIFNIAGRRLYEEHHTKLTAELKQLNYNEFIWDGTASDGDTLPAGFYFGVISATAGTKEERQMFKIAIIK